MQFYSIDFFRMGMGVMLSLCVPHFPAERTQKCQSTTSGKPAITAKGARVLKQDIRVDGRLSSNARDYQIYQGLWLPVKQ